MLQLDGKIHSENTAINPAGEPCSKCDYCPEYELNRHHCNENGGKLCARKTLEIESKEA